MTREESVHKSRSPAYRVEPPRLGDAIGHALRDAYERDLSVPEDMAAALRRLNGGYTRTAG